MRGIERRVLWLANSVVHHANRVGINASGFKVGDHKASMVSIVTAPSFVHLASGDRTKLRNSWAAVPNVRLQILGFAAPDPRFGRRTSVGGPGEA